MMALHCISLIDSLNSVLTQINIITIACRSTLIRKQLSTLLQSTESYRSLTNIFGVNCEHWSKWKFKTVQEEEEIKRNHFDLLQLKTHHHYQQENTNYLVHKHVCSLLHIILTFCLGSFPRKYLKSELFCTCFLPDLRGK